VSKIVAGFEGVRPWWGQGAFRRTRGRHAGADLPIAGKLREESGDAE